MQLAAYLEKHESAADLARKLGISDGMISHIIYGRRKPSPAMAKQIERATEGRVRRHELRPDIWDAPKRRAAA